MNSKESNAVSESRVQGMQAFLAALQTASPTGLEAHATAHTSKALSPQFGNDVRQVLSGNSEK